MNNTEEQHPVFIPRNFIEKGTFMGGMFKIRNAIEGGILAILITIPVINLPLTLTVRIIILCMTALPAAMISLIGIGGESITAFLMNALRFLKNRRVIYRMDVHPEPKKKYRIKKPRNKEPKTKKRKRHPKQPAESSSEENCSQMSSEEKAKESPAVKKKERRQFDTSTKRGIRKQAREDIRILKYESRQLKKEQTAARKSAKRQAKLEKQQIKQQLSEERKKERTANKASNQPPASGKSKKKKRKEITLEDYLPIDKIANGVIYTTDHRYVKILEIEPINFLLRSAREQQGIIFSFISYLKISPVKLQIKMISKKADINKHLEQSRLEMERESDPNCRQLQKDYIQFVRQLSSREAVSRRFFLIFEYEPFNVNRKVEEKEILAALETAAQTAKTFLYQCGNDVLVHDNEDEFTTDVLYTLLNRTKCTETPLPKRINQVLTRYMESGREQEVDNIHINEFIAPGSLDFKHSNYVLVNGIYHSYLLVPCDGYKAKVMPGWLSLLINAGEGIDIDFFLHKQPKDKIQQRLGQQIRINRSKIKDASDTNADFDDLDSAIRSGYFLKQGLANNEDFYYMNLLITITAGDLEELQWRIQEMKKLLISQDMDLRSCYFLQEQGFLSSLPLVNLDKKLYELSKRNVLTTGAASCYPFVSYSICDDNGILFGVNKHNNSLVIADIFDSKQYKNSNIAILGTSGSGKTFTMQTMALRMRRKGIQVFIIAPLKGHEFYRAARNVGGTFIQISPASQNCINVMEIRKVDNSVNELLDGPTLDASALASKIQRLHVFFSLLIPDMSHEEKQLLDEALIKTYARKGITHKNESLIDPKHPDHYKAMPILGDVYDVLMETEDTKRLAHILNRLVHGSASSFNQQTNVDLTNKYTVLDISELTGSSDLLTVGMFVALDYVWDILFGVNKHNNSLVIADIFDSKQYKNSNIAILGTSGSGKTFTMQTMALRMRRKGIQVFIIAPLKGHEFYRAARNVGGTFIQISPASQNCINVMEIRKVDNSVNELLDGPTLDASALASKIQRLHVFFSLLIPDMSHEEKQLLDEALIKTYARKGITHKNESLIDPKHPDHYKAMPILGDVYDVLMETEDTKRLAHILNRLVHGSASSFNQQTNVDLTNKYTVLDISELTGSSDLLTVGMFVALDYVWDKAKENRTEEKAIFVDEVWQLIGASSNRLAAEFVLEIAKIIRAYSGAGIFATQDLNDFFALDDGKYGKGIINNCKTKIILNMEDEEAQRVKTILRLSETEVMNITHFQRGNGLISTNNNNITVEFKASNLEKELITTDRQELLEILKRQDKKVG